MIAKLFKRFSIFSMFIALLLLCFPAYLYSGLETEWLSFSSRSYNFIGILGLLLITLNAIRRIFKHARIEDKTHYYLLIYPIIVSSFPVAYLDIRLLLCTTLFFSGWASFREYIAAKNSISSKNNKILLLDSVTLISLSGIIFYEHLFLLIIPILALIFSKKSITREEIGIIVIVPIIILFTSYNLLLLLEIHSFFFSSILSEYYFTFSNTFNLSFISESPLLLTIIFLFFTSLLFFFRRRKLEHDAKTLDNDGLFYCCIIILIIGFSEMSSGLHLHYLSFPMTYYTNRLFVINRNPFLANFLFILLIITFLLFTFVLN